MKTTIQPGKAVALLLSCATLLFACTKTDQQEDDQTSNEQKSANVELVSQKNIGTQLDDGIIGVTPASDGGHLLVGLSNYNGSSQTYQGDAWAVKVNANGDIAWNRTFGGKNYDGAFAAVATTDGGFMVAASTNSNKTGDVGTNHGGSDIWMLKLKSNGDTSFTRLIGTTDNEYPFGIAATADGGFVVAGRSIDINGKEDLLVVKLNSNGNAVWQKKFGGTGDENATSVAVTSDGSILVTGPTLSNNSGDVGANHGKEDYWVLKLNANGDKIWSKVLGGTNEDWPATIKSTADGGCIIAGVSASSENGDVKGKTHGDYDLWVMKLNASGDITWNSLFGGTKSESMSDNAAIGITADGGYIITGSSKSSDGDLTANQGDDDLWVLKLNSSGQKQWSKTYGGSGMEQGSGVVVNADGTYWVTASTTSNNSGNVGASFGMMDGWVLKIKE